MITFKNTIVDLGELKKNTPGKAVFYFEGDSKEIEQVTTSCGCTGAKFDKNFVQATYNGGEHPGPFAKSIFVYMKDGKPMFITNDKKMKVRNPEKAIHVLTIQGKILS
jgi:hypothetical protein